MKKVSFHTLGCKLNFSETSTIAREFEEGGFCRVGSNERADICVINTCSVTSDADKKCRHLVRKLIQDNPNAIIAVTGCYAQLKPDELGSIDGVDIVIGNNNKELVFSQVATLMKKNSVASIDSCSFVERNNFFRAFSSSDRTRAFLKVQDGCDYSCSYCTIPLARGVSRNVLIEDIYHQAQQIVAQGHKEIVLTGVNIGDFGCSTGEKLIDLIKRLDSVEGVDRYRVSSIEPNLLTEEIIEFCAESKKFMPYFHLPLQSGSNKILSLMRRRYNTTKFRDRVVSIKRHIPNAFIGIDIIVGFPNETEEDFMDTYQFLELIEPSLLHIFPYSVRDNTDAASMTAQIDKRIKQDRAKRLLQLSDVLYNNFAVKFIGDEAKVLFEGAKKNETMYGFTENYLKVELPYDKDKVNKIVTVTLDGLDRTTGYIYVKELSQ